MIKKIIFLGLVICLALLVGCANDYVYKEDDFGLEITIDKTPVAVGDLVTVTAKFKNLSGRDIRVQTSHPDYKKLEDMVSIGMFEENTEHEFSITSIGGPRRKIRIKKDAVITLTMEFSIEELLNYEVLAHVVFFTGKGYSESVSIYSESIKIVMRGDLEKYMINQIIQSAWNTLFVAEYPNATIDDVYIEQYFGTFNQSIVVMVWLKGFVPTRNAVNFTFEDYDFTFNGKKQIRVWRNGEFYNLHESVDEDFITIGDIQTIHNLWSKVN